MLKRKIYTFLSIALLTMLLNSSLFSQETKNSNLLFSTKWEEGIVQKTTYSHTVSSIEAYCFIDENTVAMLNSEASNIILYSLTENRLVNVIHLPSYAMDFDYYNGKFHVLDFDRVFVINDKSIIEEEYYYTIPERTAFALEKFKVIDGKNIITIADGSTWELNSAGLKMIDNFHWIYKESYKARAEKLDFKSFKFYSINDNASANSKTVNISELELNDYLVTVRILGIDNQQIAFDIETASDKMISVPKRFLIFTDIQGNLISKTEIPFIYSTEIRYPFIEYNSGFSYALSNVDGLYFYEINSQNKKSILLSENSPKSLHYNDNLLINEEFDNKNIFDSEEVNTKAGNNCVTRTQVWYNAYKFLNLNWTATSSNILSSCTQIITNQFALTPITNPGTYTSTPYKWGGDTDWSDFENLISQGKYAGNKFCTRVNNGVVTYTNGACPTGTSYVGNLVAGVDCSGFVARCWETTYVGTSNMHSISMNLGDATNPTNFASLKVGDVVNKAGTHVRLCLADNPSGTVSFMESRADGWKVVIDQYSASNLSGYTCYRFNNISDARLRLAQAITISPGNVVQGGSLSVNYKVGNYGTETWTGNVELWIIQSTGNEWKIQETTSPITLAPNQTSPTYNFSTSSVTSPTGTTKLEVRVKNSSTCNEQRSYAVGDGGYSNPLSFTISSGGSTSYTITTSANPSNGGTTTGGGTYQSGQACTVTATASSNYTFNNWTEGSNVVSTNPNYPFTVSGNRTLIANFTQTNTGPGCSGGTQWPSTIHTPSASWQTVNGMYAGEYSVFNVTSGESYIWSLCTEDGGNSSYDSQLTLIRHSNGNYIEYSDDVCGLNAKITWTANFTGQVRVLVNQYNCQENSVSTNLAYRVNCNPPSQPGIISGSTNVCAGTSQSYSISPVSGATSYAWSFSGSGTPGGSGTSISLNSTSSGTLSVIANNSCGSSSQSSQYITVNNPPAAVTVSGGGTYCNNASLSASGGSGGTIYWQGINSSGTSTATPSTSQTVTQSGTYYFRANNSCGWSASGSVTVTINNSPSSPGAIAGNTSVTSGSSNTYSISSVNGATSYTWTFSGVGTPSGSGTSISLNPTSSGTLNVTANNSCGSSSASSLYITVNAIPTYTISASTNPINSGIIIGTGNYQQGSTCSLAATENPGYTFSHWTENGNWISSSQSLSFTVSANRNFVAHFTADPIYYQISASASPSAGGTISGTGNYSENSTCNLIATANTGYTFSHWTENGNWISSSQSLSFTVNANRTFVALFTANPTYYQISASSNPSIGGSITGSGSYIENSTCNLIATANTGYTFSHWTENENWISSSQSLSFTVNANRNFVAHFTADPIYYQISASANPSIGGSITGSGSHIVNSTCNLIATANTGYTFSHWTENGNWISSSQSLSFTVSANRNFVALFTANPIGYTISANPVPSWGGTVSGHGVFTQGQTCVLTAIPTACYKLDYWMENGTIVSYSDSYDFVVTENRNITAHFSEYSLDLNIDAVPISCNNPLGAATANITGGNAPYTYSWSNGTNMPFVHNLIAGNYSVSVYDNTGCSISGNFTVEQSQAPSLDFDLSLIVCNNDDPINLNDYLTVNSSLGGTVSFDGPGIFDGVFYPSTVYVGTFEVFANFVESQTSCNATASGVISVYPIPNVNVNIPFDNVCSNSQPIVLTGGTPFGGEYSGDGVIDGVFYPAQTQPGNGFIMYSYTDVYGCYGANIDFITVNTPIPVEIGIPTSVFCENDNSVLISVYPSGGYLMINGESSSLSFDPAYWGVGNHEIIYTLPNTVCNSADTVLVSVIESIEISMNSPELMDFLDTPVYIEVYPSGGTFTVNGNISGLWFDPGYWGVGTHTLTYELNNSNCYQNNSITKQLTVTQSSSQNVSLINGFSNLEVFPNPATNSIFLKSDFDHLNLVYSIIDKSGRLVQSGNISSDKAIDIKSFSPGVYTLKLQNDMHLGIFKFVKQ